MSFFAVFGVFIVYPWMALGPAAALGVLRSLALGSRALHGDACAQEVCALLGREREACADLLNEGAVAFASQGGESLLPAGWLLHASAPVHRAPHGLGAAALPSCCG